MYKENDRYMNIPIANKIILLTVLSFCSHVAANENKHPDLGGELSLNYTTNKYDKNDHRSLRSLNWDGLLNLELTDRFSLYFATGGYRVYEDETGDFLTDTVLGFADNNLANIGATGKIKYKIQMSIPTSELSRKDDLNGAIRLAVSYSDSLYGFDYHITPRIRKNFHQYKTAGEKSLEEWILSLNTGIGYSWDDFTLKASLLGGTAWSYQHTRHDWEYAGSLSGTWNITDNVYTSVSASNSGVYYDAERGTIGNIDFFNEKTAAYSISIGYTF